MQQNFVNLPGLLSGVVHFPLKFSGNEQGLLIS